MSLLQERRGNVLVLTLNRPAQRNALDSAIMRGIGATLADVQHDPDIRCIVLTGAGDRAFCAGMDLKAFAGGDMDFADGKTGMEIFTQDIYPKPIIAAVNGTAVGGGFELALACDLVVAAEHAVFGLPEVKVGLLPGGGGTLLPRRIPLAIALELGMSGEFIDAQRALSLGLVNRVVPGPRVLDEALLLAAKLSANAPLALAAVKRLMMEATGEPQWARITQICNTVFASEDAKEGAAAFAAKRAPAWKGR